MLRKIILKSIKVLLKGERNRLLQLIVVQSVISVADIGSLALLLALVHYYSLSGTASHSGFSRTLICLQQVHFLLPLVLFLLLFILKNLASFYAVKGQYHFIYRVATRISRNNIFRYLNGSYNEYAHSNSAVHISRVSYQPMEFCTYILAGVQQLFTEVVLTSIAIVAMLLFNAKLFLLLLLVLMPPVVLAAYFSRRRLGAVRSQVKESAENATQHLHEALASYVESNVFDKKGFFATRYSASQKKLSETLSQLQITQAIPARFIEVFAVTGLLLLIIVNKYGGNASLEIVNVGAFMAAAYKIIPGITRIANIGAQMRMYRHTIEAVAQDSATQTGMQLITGKQPISAVMLRDVSLRRDDKIILTNFNLALSSGDFVGISSVSGKGKTTMLNLLLGFLQPDEGLISFNGMPAISPALRQQYWRDIAYVKQQPFLIHDTILQNIILTEADYDSKRLTHAIRFAGLDSFIESFPEGINKIVSDGGKNISGGQRQRIAMARAFYKDTNLLILDEPFSELDEASEKVILVHLKDIATRGKMILLITHNRESLRFCNKTVSIDG